MPKRKSERVAPAISRGTRIGIARHFRSLTPRQRRKILLNHAKFLLAGRQALGTPLGPITIRIAKGIPSFVVDLRDLIQTKSQIPRHKDRADAHALKKLLAGWKP